MLDPDYEVFAAVIAQGSLAAAGRALRISPAMVSKRLSRLERRLGASLVHRTTRRLSLTRVGETFYADVADILTAVERAEARVSGEQGEVRGILRLSAPTSFGRLHLAPHIGAFLAAYPKVDLRIDLSDGFADLRAERIDLAVRIAPSIDPGLSSHRLATSRRILCAAPSYLAAHGEPRDIADLRQMHLLAADGQLPWRLTGPSGPETVEGTSLIRSNSSEVARELALAGIGIALRSLWDIHRDLAEGRLRQVLTDYEGSSDVGIYAVHPATMLAPKAVQAMTAFLADLYASPAPWERP